MKYRSKPTECEAMQWHDDHDGSDVSIRECADEIVAWVNANGGEARYNAPADMEPHISVHTLNGWAFAEPGHYVVMSDAVGNERYPGSEESMFRGPEFRAFYIQRPEDFERRWEATTAAALTTRGPVPIEQVCIGGPDEMTTGAGKIAAERQRQIESEGYTAARDEQHGVTEFVFAAGAYLDLCPWPWGAASFKKVVSDYYAERDLVKAGALIAAAIDRLAPAAPSGEQRKEGQR